MIATTIKIFTGLDYNTAHPKELKSEAFDLAIDCSGSGSAIESSIDLLDRGGRLCIFGVANPKTRVAVSPFEVRYFNIDTIKCKIKPEISDIISTNYEKMNVNKLQVFEVFCREIQTFFNLNITCVLNLLFLYF